MIIEDIRSDLLEESLLEPSCAQMISFAKKAISIMAGKPLSSILLSIGA